MNKTSIEWTDATWNPIRGCSRVSEGCRNCYAEKMAYRFSGPGQPYEGLLKIRTADWNGETLRRTYKPEWNGQVQFVEKHLLDPVKWIPVKAHSEECDRYADARDSLKLQCKCPMRPRRIFVNSMSDLFHENVSDEWIDKIFAVMALCPQHTFQILTKRPEREYMTGDWYFRVSERICREIHDGRWFGKEAHQRAERRANTANRILRDEKILPNVWLGVSVESPQHKDRIDILRETPAARRFLSLEPLLADLGTLDLRGIDWVIVGGESGRNARPMHPDWARSLRDQCQDAGVPFFFKQWGEWANREVDEVSLDRITPEVLVVEPGGRLISCNLDWPGQIMARVGKKAAGALLDGREWREFPEARA